MPWTPRLGTCLAAFACLASSSAFGATAADREALRATLQDILTKTTLARGRVGVIVVGLDDGKPLFARDSDELLNPASNVKLFTAAAALVKMGPEYRFETEFLAKKELGRKGEVTGPLYVRGQGDPSITTERLWTTVGELYHAGLRSVTGDLVVDDTYFDAERAGPGYDQERSDRAYMAPTGATSLNWNAVAIHVRPGETVGGKAVVDVEPSSDFFVVENRAFTVSKRSRRRLYVSSVSMGDKQRIVVAGRMPIEREGSVTWKKLDNPPLFFGQTLKVLLEERGIEVKGRVKQGVVPPDAKRLYVAESDSLDTLVRRMNKISSNFVAEQLVKALGARVRGAPGSWAKGIGVIEEFLDTEVGIPRGSYVMKNGSGLNDTNRFSAAQIARLLVYMHRRFPLEPEFLSSLGIAGRDGTLRYRMDGTEAEGRLRAKTGTLENVASLSGYCQTVGGEKLAFAIIANDFPSRPSQVVSAVDAIGATVAAYGSSAGPAAAFAAAMPPAAAGSDADLRTRIPTYVNLGRMGDKRNVPFLRTALRTERDPALKAVVAEALYLSDRDDASGARALLDAFNPGPEVFGRLKTISRQMSRPTPAVESIADLAAEGNVEALAKLVETAAQCGDDEVARVELADVFAEVGRTAPDELIATLRGAKEGTANAGLDLVAKGLARAADPDHPLPKAIRQAQGSVDEEFATYARMLDAGLSTRIAVEKLPPKPPEPKTPPTALQPGKAAGEARPGGG